MLGDGSEWVQNVRAAGGKAFIKRGRRHPVMLSEIPAQKRASILKAWCQVATSGRQHLPVSHRAPISAFEAIAGDYPVFRIDPGVQARAGDLDRRQRIAGKALLMCGIVAALTYVGTDIVCGVLYPGYSFTDQAVSELFAIGAPTTRVVVPLFSLSSLLLGAFAVGVRLSSGHNRFLRLMAVMLGGSALVGMALWNFFPMHMRGAETGFTDTMHLILATNPFVLLSIAFGVAAFRGRFRFYTAATILVLLVSAAFAFQYAPELRAGQPTPGLGLGERVAQYAYELWQAALAIVLLRAQHSEAYRFRQDA